MKKTLLLILASAMLAAFTACAPDLDPPQLKIKNSTGGGGTLSSANISKITFDDAVFNVSSSPADGDSTDYQDVASGTDHDVVVTDVIMTATPVSITMDLKKGKKYTWSISSPVPTQATLTED